MYLLLFMLAGVASWFVMPGKWLLMLSWLARRISGFKPRERTVDGVRWQYYEGGRGPTLVILHGLAAEADHWLGVAGLLRRDFHILAPDLPGFGRSEPPAQLDFHIRNQSARLAAWLDDLDVGECLLAGNSMGAWVAADFAATHPGRARALWLQDPFGVLSAPPSEIMSALFDDGTNPFHVDSMADYKRLIHVMFKRPPHVPYPIARAGYLNARRLRTHLPRMQTEILRESESIESLAPRLDMPVLVEWGKDDRAVNVAGAQILAGLLPQAHVVLRDDIAHLPMMECPVQCANTFREFARERGLLPKA
jgi:pimeloyl-ACP methyl ester carboxylesterase